MLEKLYTKDVLRLTVAIPHLGRLDRPDGTAMEKSPQCGSSLIVDIKVKDGRITDFAQDVKACALAQASAAILGANAVGASEQELNEAYKQLESMLKNDGPLPTSPWDTYGVLSEVRGYPPRHDSVLLPLKTILAAFSKCHQTG